MGQAEATPAQPLEAAPTESPPVPLTPEPAPAAAPSVPQPEPSPTVEGEPPVEAPAAPEPVAWAELRETSDVLAHEAFSEPVEAIRTESHARGIKEGNAVAQRRMQGFLDQQTVHTRQIAEGVGVFAKHLQRLSKDGGDLAELDRIMEDHKETLGAVSGIHQFEGKWEGARGIWKLVADALGDTEIEAEYDSRILAMRQGMPDADIGKEMLTALTDTVTKPLKDEIKELKLKVERTEVEAKARQKNGQAQPADVAAAGGGGQGRSDRELLMDPATPVAKLQEIRARQRA